VKFSVKNNEANLHTWRKHVRRLYFLDCPSLPEEDEYLPALHGMQLVEEQRLNSDMVLISYRVIINY
jgi:hypothetical protein